jgi:hypothetical protein
MGRQGREMKKIGAILLLTPMLMGCSSCVSLLTSRAQSWEMIQSVGGLRVDDPVRQPDGHVFLPVVCDVSGLVAITVKPTMMNSALVVRKVAVRRRAERIQLQVVTCLVDHRHTSLSTRVDLGVLNKGFYLVEYRNPNGITIFVRKIEIN